MKLRILLSLGFCFLMGGGAAAGSDGRVEATPIPQVQELQEKMTGDAGMMSLIMTLQNDADVQALLNDPQVMKAVQAGDIGALLSDARFIKLLDKPQVKEISKGLESAASAEVTSRH